jgi:hypothetical protein
VETPTPNLILNQSEFHIDRGIALRTGQMQLIRECFWWLAKFHSVDIAPAFDLVRDEMPCRNIRKTQSAFRIHHLCRLPDDWFFAAEIEPPEGLVPRTSGDLLPQFNSAFDKGHPEESALLVQLPLTAPIDMIYLTACHGQDIN